MPIRRGFVDVAEGQMHYRIAGSGPRPPLVVLHAAPAASGVLERQLLALAATRPVVAFDALGMGDSSPPAVADPDIPYYAGATARALAALGIERYDVHGILTGANSAIELALQQPGQVRRVIVDRLLLMDAATRAAWLADYAPTAAPDALGSQLRFAWHFVRDEYCFFPWYARDGAHRSVRDIPTAEQLHDKVVEVLRGIRTYHLFLRAGLRYPGAERLARLTQPVLTNEAAAPLLPGAKVKRHRAIPDATFEPAEAIAANTAEIVGFLDA
ncbi:MAG: alpha/beta hydrolase [Alphaproteobacteria bacterium]|nr:alpha/beta hydrolase [Alphaproteobacteria bacterium]